ncbi:exosortase EpsH [Candidatus Mancarchaeum acidiphilum]|uniref:Exosortase EpsH n=1 Tax=Candidatus Mancarchaeum acidiphilum TaxID=1920749 RepID=A0A218NLV4_9ARCH|nr:archaeosortase/exosortase family protein [Candidatus Mancarchaeum acidiphilum]ASI13449.1 exosortase EpsH [Candidatus Mancarchaeum acidiphilum]
MKSDIDYKTNKLFGIIVLLISFLIIELSSIISTSFVISDTNQASYIIVVMLMLPLTILFSIKEDIHISRKWYDYAIGIAVFILYLTVFAYARAAMSFGFMSYRIDALLLPLVIISLTSIIFGSKNIKKFKFVIIYSLFASPVLLLPLLKENLAFTYLNASLIFSGIKLFDPNLVRVGLVITSPLGYQISIASTCADIGAFVSIMMFMLPLGYLYNGKLSHRALWIVVSVVFLLLLNFFRMFLISLIWIYYGLSAAILTLHLFFGELIFDIVIIVMILVASKFGMSIPKLNNNKSKTNFQNLKNSLIRSGYMVIVIALISIIGIFLSYPITSSVQHNPISFASAVPNMSEVQFMQPLEASNMTILYVGQVNGSAGSEPLEIFTMTNKTFSNNSLINALSYDEAGLSVPTILKLGNTKTIKSSSVILNNGITLHYAKEVSNGTVFYSNLLSIPYKISEENQSRYVTINYLLATTKNFTSCNIDLPIQNRFDSLIYNTINGNSNKGRYICAAYKIIDGAGNGTYG